MSAVPYLSDAVPALPLDMPDQQRDEFLASLIEREDKALDHLRQAAVHLGLRPEFVADVLAHSGLGTKPSDEMLAIIRANAVAYMNELRDQQ